MATQSCTDFVSDDEDGRGEGKGQDGGPQSGGQQGSAGSTEMVGTVQAAGSGAMAAETGPTDAWRLSHHLALRAALEGHIEVDSD